MKKTPAGRLSRIGLSFFISLLLLVVAISFFPFSGAQEISNPEEAKQKEIKARNFSELLAEAQEKGSARVIIRLKVPFQDEGKLNPNAVVRQRERIRREQDEFFQRIPADGISEEKRFRFIPFIAAEIETEALARLQNDPEILSIEKDELAAPTLVESTQVVGAPAAWTNGFSGAGQTIAVLDSGVDKTHSFFAGKIVAEGCFSTTHAPDGSTSLCPSGAEESIEPGSGVNCPGNVTGCSHGTHVAGIAAGRGTSASGVAKDANIIAIQVFSRFDNAQACGTSPVPCMLSYTSDQILALERVRALSSTMNIAAVNMSLGGGQYSSNCDAQRQATKAAIDNLRSVGIATVVASGNNSYTSAIGAPACISSAISVGSTDDGGNGTTQDNVSSFSNSSPVLHLLAPGKWISSSVPNGGFQNLSGTSMATPHVAGAFAILKQRKPDATVSQMLRALRTTGRPISDSRNNIVKPRIQIDRALERINSSAAPADFDGDGKSDVSVFRPASGSWFVQKSSDNSFSATQFGVAADLIAPGDYDGDGKTDVAVFRPTTGNFFILNSSNGTLSVAQFGAAGDVPVPADFDGDGKADVAVFRPATGGWYRLNSSNNQFAAVQFGIAEDKPAVGDFDGDGRADISVYRPSAGAWYRLNSSNDQFAAAQFGIAEDKAVPADYDGDGKTDIAVFRPSTGSWYFLNSGSGQFSAMAFGIAEDKPVPGDYDGDGKSDLAVFRPSTGSWFLLRSAQGFAGTQFGMFGDLEISNLIF
jgi:subtilisin